MKVDYKIKEMCHAGGFTLVRVSQIKRITEIGFHQKIKRGKFTIEQLNELASIVGCEVECCYVFPNGKRIYIQKAKGNNMKLNYKEMLLEKVQKEYEELLEELKTLTPNQLIKRAYEKVIKQEFVILFESNVITEERAKALYLCENTLEALFQEWLSNSYTYKDVLIKTANDKADKTTQRKQ